MSQAVFVGNSFKSPMMDYASYPLDCSIMDFRVWIKTETNEPTQNATCPLKKILDAISDKIISNIKENEMYVHDSFVTNKTAGRKINENKQC